MGLMKQVQGDEASPLTKGEYHPIFVEKIKLKLDLLQVEIL